MARLYRSSSDRMLAGVCGGLADYLGMDSTMVRLGFVLLSLFAGTGLLVYLIAALILPKGDGEYVEKSSGNSSYLIGIVLVLLGLYMLYERFLIFHVPQIVKDLAWPLIFIGLGSYLVWGRSSKDGS